MSLFVSILVFPALALLDGTWLARFFTLAGVSEVAGFIVAIGVLIFIHELGHFLTAKGVGVGVERFSLGFGPRLWGVKRGETDYRVSAVPLGGYVKMIGEDPKEGEALPEALRARSFAHKPLWARFLIVFAGPGSNFVLAAFIFTLVFAFVGRQTLPAVAGRVLSGGPAQTAGFRTGDQITAVDRAPVKAWDEVRERVSQSGGRPLVFEVRRGGEALSLTVTPRRERFKNLLGDETEEWEIGVAPYLPPQLGEVRQGDPAAKAGLRAGDVIRTVDGEPVEVWDDLAERIHRSAGRALALTVDRGGQTMTIQVIPQATRQETPLGEGEVVGLIGISPAASFLYIRSNPILAMGEGVARTWEITALTGLSLWKLVTRRIPASNIGGPIRIAQESGQQARQGFVPYAFFVAVISINLGLLNLLPVPVLDGGHIFFFAVEAVLGKPVGLRTREIAHQVGFVLLLLLMVFAMYNDLIRLFR